MAFLLILNIITIPYGLFFKPTIINIFHPLVFSYKSSDTVYVLSKDGYLFPLTWSKDSDGLHFAVLDSINLYIRDVCCADFNDGKLWIGTASGGYEFSNRRVRKLNIKYVEWITHSHNHEIFLSNNKLYIYKKGHRIGHVKVAGKYIITPPGAHILVSGNGVLTSVSLDSLESSVLYKDQSYNYFYWDEERERNPHFTVKIWANGDHGTLLYLGFDTKTDKSKILYVTNDLRKIRPISEKGLISHITFKNGNFWVFYERNGITFLKLINEKSLEPLDSFRFQYYLSEVKNIYDNYWFIVTYGGVSYLFKKTDFHKYYNNQYWTRLYRIFSGGKLIDFDGDGDKDLLFLVTSDRDEDIYKKSWGITILENQLPESLNKALFLFRKAREFNNYIKCETGLKDIDLALETFSILLPESLGVGFELRNSIYQKVYIKGKAKKIFTVFIYMSIFIVLPFGLVALFYSKYQKEREMSKTIPSAETIGIILSMDIFHKFASKWYPIMSDNSLLTDKIDEILEETAEIMKILRIPKVRYEFKEAPKEWRQIYKSLLSTLLRLRSYIKLYKKFLLGRRFFTKRIKENINTIGELRKSFKKLSEGAKEDVVTNALLPVIEKIQKEISDTPIKISTDIKTDLPYLYYPDEITEIRTAIQAIIDNAVESFDNFSPENSPEIRVKVRSSISELKIEIEDNGKGIPEEIKAFIFDEGFSYGKEGKNRGVGLSNAKRIIDKFGEIAVISKEGKGTKFVIKLIFGKREV